MNEERRYVRVDEHGVMRIGNSRVMLDSIVAGFEQGHSPETLQNNMPRLVWKKYTEQSPIILRIRMRCMPTSNGKTSYGRHGVPRARPGRAPSLSVCEHYGQQRLPSTHESASIPCGS